MPSEGPLFLASLVLVAHHGGPEMRCGRKATSITAFLVMAGILSVGGYVALDTPTEPVLQIGVGSADLELATDTPKATIDLATDLYPGTDIRTLPNGKKLSETNQVDLTINFVVPPGKKVRWILRIYNGDHEVWKQTSEPLQSSNIQISPLRTGMDGLGSIQVTGSARYGDPPVNISFTSTSNWTWTSGTYVVGNLPGLGNGGAEARAGSGTIDWLPGSWYPSPNMNFSETYTPESPLNVLRQTPANGDTVGSVDLKFTRKGGFLIPGFTAQDPRLVEAEKRRTVLGGLVLGIAGSSLVATLQAWRSDPGQGGLQSVPVGEVPTIRATRRTRRRGVWLGRACAAVIVMSIVRFFRGRR